EFFQLARAIAHHSFVYIRDSATSDASPAHPNMPLHFVDHGIERHVAALAGIEVELLNDRRKHVPIEINLFQTIRQTACRLVGRHDHGDGLPGVAWWYPK